MSETTASPLIAPYGGELIDLRIPADRVPDRRRYANRLPSIRLTERTVCDLELLADGAFSPLDRFMSEQDLRHPLVAEMHRWGKRHISGPIEVLQTPPRYDFKELRLTPAETRARLAEFSHANVVAFQTPNPLHRVHEELTKRACAANDGVLLLHPVVGMPHPGDVEHYTRVRTYRTLAETYPPRHRQGCCVWFTGLHNAGKSTTASVLTSLLLEHGRQVTLLDGDVVRTHFSEGLGFSKADRDDHVRRMGFVAAEIVRHGGIAVCAAVSPYRATRNDVRAMMGDGHYIEVFVDTPLAICEQRDTKGLYARARSGELRHFTGLDDPYEPPRQPELRLETVGQSVEDNARALLAMLVERGFVRPD